MSTPARQNQKKLGEILVEKGLVSTEQLDMALADQKKHGGLIGEILVGWGYTTEEAIVQTLIEQFGFAFIQPTLYPIEDEVIALLPKETVSRFSVLPVERKGAFLSIAMSNPLHEEALEEVERITQLKPRILITTYTEVLRSIERYYEIRKPGST